MIVLQELINRALENDRFFLTEDDNGVHLFCKFVSLRIHLATISHADIKAKEANRLKVVS